MATPVSLSSFVGREAELELGRELLSRSRLVTITGPGGAGKTRLAVELVRDGALAFCDLAPAADGDAAQAAIASALGLEPESGGAGRERIARRLQPETGVLVMDNCEQVVDAAADLAEAMLGSAPAVRVLATSQEPLALAGENLLRLGALTEQDARRLFVERLREGDPRFEADAEAGRLIAEICARLDGIPLALELAAARARTMPLADLLGALEDRFALLRTASRRAPTRQQTLEAAVAWSYGLLTPEERELFDRLAVLPGRFQLAAAQAVAAGAVSPRDVALLLSRLGERSLLESDGGGYRMPETLRAFGRERLGEAQTLADTLVLAARHFDEAGAFRTGLAVTLGALAAVSAADPGRYDLLELAAKEAERAARYDVGAEVLDELRRRPEIAADPERLAFVEMRFASAGSMATGDIERVLPAAEHALSVYRDLGQAEREVQAEVELAWLEGLAGRVDRQAARSAEVLARAEAAVPETQAHLHALGCAGCGALFAGDLGRARRLLETGVQRARREQDSYQLGWFTGMLGQLVSFTEGPRPALRLLAETRPLLTENLDPVFTEAEAHALLLAGDPAALLAHTEDDEVLFISFGIRGGLCMSARAAAAAELGQAASARRLIASAHRLFAGSDIYYQRRGHAWLEARADWSLGVADAAPRLLEAAEGVLARTALIAPFAFRDAVDAAWDAGDEELEARARGRLEEIASRLEGPVFAALLELGTPSGTEALGRLGCRGLRARSLEREGRLEEAAAAYDELGLSHRLDRSLQRLVAAGRSPASPVAARLARLVLFDGVPAAELESLAGSTARLTYEAGDRLYDVGSAAGDLFAIVSGAVRLTVAGTGAVEIGAGELAGERSLLGGEVHVTAATATGPTEALRLPPAALLEAVRRRPALAERLVTLVHQRLRQEARLAGEAEPPDVAGRVLAGLRDAAAAAGGPMPAFEILPVYLADAGPVLLKPAGDPSWLVDAAPGRLPAEVIADALDVAGCPAEIVHSTSWRFDAGRLVLTYLAIMPAGRVVGDFQPVPVRRAELARGTAKGAPESIDVGQVVEHGLRHLSWLSRDDPVIREELSPEWLALVAEYQPEPFRAL